jgi:hypothetical protein
MDQQTATNSVPAEMKTERKPYVAPVLTDFGSFAEITQGTFAGVGVDNTVYS